ncbi:hypothetical protein LguiB_025579 [Lonicera macranthoides]
MRVFKWSSNFRGNDESSISFIWVNMPDLPIHFLAKQSLFSISGLIGLPLKTDAATASITRPSVARICVEMNLLQKFPSRVWIGTGFRGFWQPLSLVWFTDFSTRKRTSFSLFGKHKFRKYFSERGESRG